MTYPQVEKAIRFATKQHAGQERDGSNPLPYITHPIEVLVNLRHVGGVVDEDLLAAAVLHDVVEESQVEYSTLEEQFGPRVTSLVKELTRHEPSKSETRALNREEIWQLRAAMLLEDIAKMSHDAQCIKLADRLTNLEDATRNKLGDKLVRYLGQSYLILETIPAEVNPRLWNAVRESIKKASNMLEGVANGIS